MPARPALLLSSLATLVLLWGLGHAILRGLAGGADHLVHSYLDAPPRDDPRAWEGAHHFHMAAMTFGGTMPEVVANGSLLFRRGALLSAGERAERLAVALDLQRTAVRLRPAWPYGWQELITTKSEMGVWDSELILAFDRVLDLGRAEPLLHEALSRVGFAHWRLLSVAHRERLLGLVRQALATDPQGVFRAAQDTASELVLCSRLSDAPGVREYCRDQGLD